MKSTVNMTKASELNAQYPYPAFCHHTISEINFIVGKGPWRWTTCAHFWHFTETQDLWNCPTRLSFPDLLKPKKVSPLTKIPSNVYDLFETLQFIELYFTAHRHPNNFTRPFFLRPLSFLAACGCLPFVGLASQKFERQCLCLRQQ